MIQARIPGWKTLCRYGQLLLVPLGSMLAAGCGSSSTPVTPQTIVIVSGNGETGSVGSTVVLVIRVLGSDNQGYAGASVSFQVLSGGGSVSPATVNTGPDGQAQTTFTLGTTAGAQQVRASVGSVTPVTFDATATAGSPASVEAVGGTDQTAKPNEDLPQMVTVRVRDQYQNAVPQTQVTFDPSGDGQASPAQASTSAQGEAQTTWTLGSDVGEQTLTASAGSAQVMVTATAFDPCLVAVVYTIGQTAQGELDTEDCSFQVLGSVRFVDFFSVEITQPIAAEVTQTSNNPFLFAFTPGSRTGGYASVDGVDQQVPLRLFLPEGETLLAVSGSTGGTVGAYELSSQQRSTWLVNCEVWWLPLVPGQGWQIPGSLASTDCVDSGYNIDFVDLYLAAGQSITVLLNSTDFDAFALLVDPDGNLADSDDNGGGGTNSRIDFVATQDGTHQLQWTSRTASGTGAYTLFVYDNTAATTAVAQLTAEGGAAVPTFQRGFRSLGLTNPAMGATRTALEQWRRGPPPTRSFTALVREAALASKPKN